VVPTVVRDEVGPLARWRPALQGPDVVAFGALVTAMPPVCRAGLDWEDAHDLVTDALQVLTDAASRDRLGPGVDLVPSRRGRRPKRPPTIESWLAALTAADGRFDADDDEASALERELRPWAEIGTGRVGPARATFRLSEVEPQAGLDGPVDHENLPSGGSAGWRLEFLLQSTQDPSLLVPAAQAWSDDGSLRRWLDRPHELLLTELGRASRIYPELAAGLRQATPHALDLDADGAHHFLAVVVPALDEAGFGVLLPSWWDRRARLGIKATASTPTDGVVASSHFGRESLMDFRWQLAVGDDTLTDEEIAALAETKAPLVRLRGQWVAVDPEQLRRGLEFLRRELAAVKTAAEVLALAANHPDDLDTPLPV
jgi:ribosomal protein L29